MTMTINQNTTDNPHYVTPEEADYKLCQMAKRKQNAKWEYYCDGPKCMAWRWVNLIKEVKDIDDCVIREGLFSTTHGFCGMVRS